MGNLCSSCFGSEERPHELIEEPENPEARREQMLAAAERRRQENEHRGIKNMDKVRQMEARSREIERREEEAARTGRGEPALKWQTS